jgi:hypothetical protein
MSLEVPKTEDFKVDGTGSAAGWKLARWNMLSRVGGKSSYRTRAKTLYSESGIYFLIDCEDRRLACTHTRDRADLFREDVVEVFLQPDARHPAYFEYEISPLGMELPIVILNNSGSFHGWLPWKYVGPRRVRRATSVRGGRKAPGARVSGWTAEFFIPFELLKGFANVPPRSGARWRGNIYRIDYDEEPLTQWAWCPSTGPIFHNYRRFASIVFK